MAQTDSSRADAGPMVLLLSADSQMKLRVDRTTAMVLVELTNEDRRPVHLAFTGQAAVRFAQQLRHGFEQLCQEQGKVSDDGGGS